jgi:hypothetical protein
MSDNSKNKHSAATHCTLIEAKRCLAALGLLIVGSSIFEHGTSRKNN